MSIMYSIKFIDKNHKSILIKYDFRSGENWFVNHYFDIEGDICHSTDFDKIQPANKEQTALMNFVMKNHNTKGSEYLFDFDALASDVSRAEFRRQDITLLSDKTEQELCNMIYDFRENNNLQFSIDNIERVIALLQHLQNDFELPIECLSQIQEGYNSFSIFNRQYLILTENEANEKTDSYYRGNMQELLGIDNKTWDKISPYFDEDKFVEECWQYGRGNALSFYNGREIEVCVEIDGKYKCYFIYRQG